MKETNGYKRIKTTSLQFVSAMKIGEHPGVYSKEQGAGESFYGSYHAAHVLDLFGELESLSPEHKQNWAQQFLSRQTTQGYFSGNTNDHHRYRKIEELDSILHYTRGNIWALRLLNAKPVHPFTFIEPLLDPGTLYRWVMRYNWSNAWAAGNQVLSCATILFALRDWFGVQEVDIAMERGMYPALEELLDRKTGFWGTQRGSDLPNGLFGTIHIAPIYFAQGWPLPQVEKNIDSTLACQLPDGSFWPGGSDCPDYDGAYMLANLAALSDYRQEDMRKAARSYLAHALLHEDPNGNGWLLHKRDCNPSDWKPRPHWIWKDGENKATAEYRDEDPSRTHIMLGSWFYPLSIALISDMLGDTGYEGPYHFNGNSLHVRNVPSIQEKYERTVKDTLHLKKISKITS